tara:strand:+ start:2516 stop:3088 length:573 start_codon:yes stop_codon:yes gene_type:complete
MARSCPSRNWQNATATLTLTGTDPTPVAAISLLLAADQAVIDVGVGLYASCARMVEANTTGLTRRRFGVVVPPGCVSARLHVLRCGGPDLVAQANTTGGNTTGGFTGVDVITSPSAALGVERYLQTGASAPTSTAYTVTSAVIDNAPAGSKDRAYELTAALAPAVVEFEVNFAAGVSVEFFNRSPDLELL